MLNKRSTGLAYVCFGSLNKECSVSSLVARLGAGCGQAWRYTGARCSCCWGRQVSDKPVRVAIGL